MLLALMTVAIAGGMNGSFAAPMNRVRGWQWEHIWFVWSVLAMLVIPLVVALATVSHLGAVYTVAGPTALISTALYGMLWGGGTVLFGLGIERIGIALSFGIVLGTSSSAGTLIPLLMQHHARSLGRADFLLLAGAAFILLGVAANARGGLLRETTAAQHVGRGSFATGLLICLLSGIGSSCMSLALNKSAPILEAAESFGAPETASLNAVWPVLLGGGMAVNVAYCVFLFIRRRNIGCFRESVAGNGLWVLVMAVLWSGSNFVYGFGARGLGPQGLVVGWPIFMALIVLSANAWGVLNGEWRSGGARSAFWAATGCSLLIGGIWIVAWSGRGGR
jgi:L-rhamnose-H+ transport protein